MSDKPKSYALLIDGDNIAVSLISPLLDQIMSSFGKPIIRRIYLNNSSLATSHWVPIINEYSLKPEWIPNNTSGKNAVDIALVIDAMDLLSTSPDLAGFCIVSSDGDFTRLASHLVGKHKRVLGIGEAKTPNSFVSACSKFAYIEDLLQPEIPIEQQQHILDETQENQDTSSPEQAFESLFIQAYLLTLKNADGWVQLIEIKKIMAELDPEIDVQNTRKLAEKVQAFANCYPTGIIKIAGKPESKPLIHYIQIDIDAFRLIEAYKQESAKEQNKWVTLSGIGSELSKQPVYENGFSYRGIKQLKKVVAQMSKDYPKTFKFREIKDENTLIHQVHINE